MTLGWGIPMSIFACAIFWKLGALTIMSSLALISVAMVTGFGFAAVWYELVKRMYGPAKDD
jgi:nitrate reductase NapE component